MNKNYFIEIEDPNEQTRFLQYIARHVDKQTTTYQSYFAIRDGDAISFVPGYDEYLWSEPLRGKDDAHNEGRVWSGEKCEQFIIHYKEQDGKRRLRVFHPIMNTIKDFVCHALKLPPPQICTRYLQKLPPYQFPSSSNAEDKTASIRSVYRNC